MIVDACTKCHFNLSGSTKHHIAQSRVELIESHHLFQCTTFSEFMSLFVCLHRAEIAGQSEITDDRECLKCFLFIGDDKSTLLQQSEQIRCVECWFVIFHKQKKKKSLTLVRCFSTARGENGHCKCTNFFHFVKYFDEKMPKPFCYLSQ